MQAAVSQEEQKLLGGGGSPSWGGGEGAWEANQLKLTFFTESPQSSH